MENNQKIKEIGSRVESIFKELITDKISGFEVIKKEYLPEGLKPHTRSICWLAEQVILQNTKKYTQEFNITNFTYPISDISPWDVKFRLEELTNEDIFINIKVTDITKPIRKNDIASVKALLNFYHQNNHPLLFYVVIKLEFHNNSINFKETPIVRYYPWIKDFVVNPRNEHLQNIYESDIKERSVEEFVKLIKEKAIDKGLEIP